MRSFYQSLTAVVVLLLAISCGPASGGLVFHVSSEGDDDNPGTRPQPLRHWCLRLAHSTSAATAFSN